ncbi:unnamed protein product [Brassica napus]|uniref:(rape) hypothetical protein n=1 Tax=Brassica napus TaxID=3708 RepID=A0A816WA72_BRANA|nr:unnamed protein product [Brassica napus]
MIDAASTTKSTTSSSNNHYIADVANLTSFSKIYPLMQCTPYLSPGDCDYCLRESVGNYNSCCGQRQGVLVMRPSCLFRWKLYPFFKAFDNGLTLASPPPPPVAARPPAVDQASTIHNEDSKGNSVGIVAAITIPNVAVLILLVVGTFLWRRRKSFNKTQNESDTDISAAHSSQYDFKTIEAATNKFLSSNKLGEGGFGEVYKGMLPNGTEAAVENVRTRDKRVQERGCSCKKFFIYEFVPNKSLNHFKFDANMNPKISDFGLSTIFGT